MMGVAEEDCFAGLSEFVLGLERTAAQTLFQSEKRKPDSNSTTPPPMALSPPLDFSALTPTHLSTLSTPIHQTLTSTPYTPPTTTSPSTKSLLQTLLLSPSPFDFLLSCAFLTSAETSESPAVHWVPNTLSGMAKDAVGEVAGVVAGGDVGRLVEGVMPELFPGIKGVVKGSCVDAEEVGGVRVDVAEAVVAAHQFRWLVTQISYPRLGNVCPLVLPCALTCLDHWSPEVKAQGMVCFIHLAKNVDSANLSWYEDPIFDACCQNIASSDELWHLVVEMSALLLTSILHKNPRSPWFERILTDMLSHLERQPMNKERRTAWLQHIGPVFDAIGLILLAHFRRIFSLLFQWLHADDNDTLILVLELIHRIVKLTWIRKSPLFDKLVDELTLVYKEASMRKDRDAIRTIILQILILVKQCKGLQFETAWNKHKNDSNLTALMSSLDECSA